MLYFTINMSRNENLDDFFVIKLDVEDTFKNILGKTIEFPKYTTQIINIANQNAQGTRPDVVGQMSELIHQCPKKTYNGWKEWYQANYPDAIKRATDRVFPMVENMRKAMDLIDNEMVADWIEDLVITKTAEGLIIQEIILKYLANENRVEYRLADPNEESQNIDGYIGDIPVQIKPSTYLAKNPTVRETIEIEMIYYKKTSKYLYIYTTLVE